MGDYYCSGELSGPMIANIAVASVRAVGCAVTLAAVGLGMAKVGMMTPELARGLSQFSVRLAIPALLFSSVVPGVSGRVLSFAWPLLLLPALNLLLGLLAGLLTVVVVQPPEDFRLGTVAACSFGNTQGIPIVLLSVMQQSLGRAAFANLADPLLFLSLELLTYPLLQWLLGLALLRFAGVSENEDSPQLTTTAPGLTDSGSLLGGRSRPLRRTRREPGAASHSYIPMLADGENAAEQFGRPTLSNASSRDASALHIGDAGSSWADHAPGLCEGCRRAALRIGRRSLAVVRLVARRALIPPALGVALGVLVGLYDKGLVLPPEVAPLGWLYLAIEKLGAAAVPVNFVLLGAALASPPAPDTVPPTTVLGITAARLLVLPCLGIGVARLLVGAGLPVPVAMADPFWLVVLVVNAAPTANNIVALAEIAGDDRRAMSAAIFYQYCAAPLLLPGVLTLFVVFVCHTREMAARSDL